MTRNCSLQLWPRLVELSEAGHQSHAGVVVGFISLPGLSLEFLLGKPDKWRYRYFMKSFRKSLISRKFYCYFPYEKSFLLMSKYNLLLRILRIIKDNHCVVLTTSVGGKESSTNIISFFLINFLLLILSTNEI